MDYIFNPMGHIKPIRTWARQHGARFGIGMETFRIRITLGDVTHELTPRFIVRAGEGLAYTHLFMESGFNFVGWLPYEMKRWPLASDKIIFKEFCRDHGLLAPRYWRQGMTVPTVENFIVKQRNGSFGQRMRGPFRTADVDPSLLIGTDNEYHDEFIVGKTAKIWFWGARPMAMDSHELPYLVGDGHRTVREIAVTPRGSFDKAYPIEQAEDMLHWQGLRLDDVPTKGRKVTLDYRYATPFDPVVLQTINDLPAQSEAFQLELQRIGAILATAIPSEIRPACMFTLDAIIDTQERLWLLEMNSHPMIHAALYRPMLDELFGIAPGAPIPLSMPRQFHPSATEPTQSEQ